MLLGVGTLGVLSRAAEDSWLAEKVQEWMESAKNLLGIAHNHPQSAYAGLYKSLQQEWAFVQRVTPGIGNAFGPAEQALQESFIPDLFQGLGNVTAGRGVTRLPVKQAGLDLPDVSYPKTCKRNGLKVFLQHLFHLDEGVSNAGGDLMHEYPLLLE